MIEVKARGPNFVYTKKYILQEYGPEIWGKLLSRLPMDAAEIWLAPPLANMSYPFSAFKLMVANLSKEAGIVKEAETARLYEFIADNSLNILYKAFFQLANPSFVIRNYPKLWTRFFEAGKVEVPVAEKGHAIVKFIFSRDLFRLDFFCLSGLFKKSSRNGWGQESGYSAEKQVFA